MNDDMTLGTVAGRQVTQADIDAMVANAEAGFPDVRVSRVIRRGVGSQPLEDSQSSGISFEMS